MKMIILEGLPMVGKTTIIQYIKSLCIDNVNCVDELIIDTKELDQDSFMKNDLMKINKYNSSLVFIDKGLISTLSYNEMLDYLNGNPDLERVKDWFKKYGEPLYARDDVYTIYLKNKKIRLRENNSSAPHGSVENQEKMAEILVNNIKKFCKNYEIIEYEYEDMEKFVDETINKYMCS